MEFSCHTWAFNDLTLPEALGTIARLGFRRVDIGSGPHLNAARASNPSTQAGMVQEIQQDLSMFNLQLGDLLLLLPRISIADEARRQADLTLFKSLMPFAKALGTPGITVSPGLIHPAEDSEAWDRTVGALREMLAAAQAAEIPLSIEPHMDSMAQKPEQALKLLKEVPGLKLTLDWAQFVCQDVFHDDTAALLPYTRHIQLRQAARAQLQLPFARGRIDLRKVIESLWAANYEGDICIEYMQTTGWHGSVAVNIIQECALMRDALRKLRDEKKNA